MVVLLILVEVAVEFSSADDFVGIELSIVSVVVVRLEGGVLLTAVDTSFVLGGRDEGFVRLSPPDELFAAEKEVDVTMGELVEVGAHSSVSAHISAAMCDAGCWVIVKLFGALHVDSI